ncbi:tail connector protein [Fusobacterium phage FNU_1P]|nr:tail connector protein [Fusobacterium phage FNU_1P]
MIDIVVDKVKIIEDLKNMLLGYNYTLQDDDKLFDIILPKNLQNLKNILNRKEVPDELYYVFLCRCVGEYLNTKYFTNTLNIDTLNFEPMLASLTEGGVSMSFKGNTNQETFSNVVQRLMDYGDQEIYRYRFVGW